MVIYNRLIITLPNLTMKIARSDILTAITQYFEEGDLSFIETVNNITYGYKRDLKANLTQPNHDRLNQ